MKKAELIREIANYIRSTASAITHVEIGMGSRIMRIDLSDNMEEENVEGDDTATTDHRV